MYTVLKKRHTSNGQHYFIIKDANAEILATSELYWSPSSRDYAIMIIKREAPDALIEEQSRITF